MITHFLSKEQVSAYCKDFADRIVDLGDEAPKVWCPIGFSGLEIFKIIAKFLPEDFQKKIKVQPIAYRKPAPGQVGSVSVAISKHLENQKEKAEAEVEADLHSFFQESPSALIIDSSVHSGSSMIGAEKYLKRLGAKSNLTYSLVIKQNSGFVPHYFGLVVGAHDRALFLLEKIPNNRLSKPKQTLKGNLRKLTEEDAISDYKLDTGVPSISKVGFGDLWYEMRANGYQVYIIEDDGRPSGYVKYKITPSNNLFLDTIAVEKSLQGNGVGGALFRWVETTARASACQAIELWGISTEVESYKKAGYIGRDRWLKVGGDESYLHMSKPLLYHFDLKWEQTH